MTQTPEEKKVLEKIQPILPLDVNTSMIDNLSDDDEGIFHEMLIKAFNHYYAAPSVDLEQRARAYVSEVWDHTNSDPDDIAVDIDLARFECKQAYLAGSRDLGQMEQWVSVEERMPIDKRHKNVFCEDDLCIYTAELGSDNEWYHVANSRRINNVTHWMPLPSPPIK